MGPLIRVDKPAGRELTKRRQIVSSINARLFLLHMD